MALKNECVFFHDDLPKRSFSFFSSKRTQFCDITFKVGERSVNAHRIILAAAIPYFDQLFSDQELVDSAKNEIALPDLDADALEALIEYAYNCEVKISLGNVKTLLSVACVFQVDEVKHACCRFMAEILTSENALDIRCYSSSLGCLELVKEIDSFIEKHFSEIMATEKFLNMPFSLLSDLISRDQLNVQSEEELFETTLRWVKKNPEERREKFPELLKNIRLLHLKLNCLKGHVGNEELIRSSALCRDLVEEAVCLKSDPKKRKETCSFCITQRHVSIYPERCAKEILNICILYEGCVVKCLDLMKEKWETKVMDNVSSSVDLSHSVVALNKKMYCFDKYVTHVLDLETNRYSSSRSMKYPRRYSVSVEYKKMAFVCGGWRKSTESNIVECFHPKTEKWTEVTPMKTPRSSMGAAVYKKFIYVLGGCVELYDVTDCVEKYNVETKKWSTSSPMLTERDSFGCCTINDKIYVFGGSDRMNKHLSTAEVFDPITGQWEFIASMNTPRWLCKSVSGSNKIYVLGGYNFDTSLCTFEIYNPEANKWQHGEPTSGNADIFGAVVVSFPSI